MIQLLEQQQLDPLRLLAITLHHLQYRPEEIGKRTETPNNILNLFNWIDVSTKL